MATATAQPVILERLPRSRSLRLPPWEKLTPLLLIAPSVILIAVFVYGFIGATMRTSLVRWNSALPDYTFVGLHNYQRLFQLDRFQADLVNTLHFTAIFLAGCIVLGLGAAVLLDQRLRGTLFFQNVYMYPLALSFVVTGTVWRWILNPNSGVNVILGNISLKIFDLVYVMTFGGPGYATDMPSLYMWIATFQQFLYARGAAIAIVLLLMVAILIVPYLVWNLRGETEQ